MTAQWLNAPIFYLDTIDSTNNYAMQLIDADKAPAGTTVLTKSQTSGKGQRGKVWADKPGQSLLMSLITQPFYPLEEQFSFSATVATTIVTVLNSLESNWQVSVKWPNDIIINDKKAGGILIENILRGNKWMYAVIGFGLNVLQESFPDHLPVATSLAIESGKTFETEQLMHILRHDLIHQLVTPDSVPGAMDLYNSRLYKRNQWQLFEHQGKEVLLQINRVLHTGQLEVMDNEGRLYYFNHGELVWKW